jgi:tetratricopeptide (TPR) repeat protein
LENIYAKKGVLDEAMSEYKKALTINPNFAKAHYNLGLAHESKGMLDEAISEFPSSIIHHH